MSDFEKWYKEFQTHRQFPMSIEDNNLYVARMAYEAGRKAGVDEGRISGLEEAADIVMTNAQPNRLSYAGIAAAIRERMK